MASRSSCVPRSLTTRADFDSRRCRIVKIRRKASSIEAGTLARATGASSGQLQSEDADLQARYECAIGSEDEDGVQWYE